MSHEPTLRHREARRNLALKRKEPGSRLRTDLAGDETPRIGENCRSGIVVDLGRSNRPAIRLASRL